MDPSGGHAALTLDHAVRVDGLDANQTYYYDVEAIGGDGGVVATNQNLPANLIGFAPYIEVFPPVGFLPLGSSIVDSGGVQLLTDWVNGLGSCP